MGANFSSSNSREGGVSYDSSPAARDSNPGTLLCRSPCSLSCVKMSLYSLRFLPRLCLFYTILFQFIRVHSQTCGGCGMYEPCSNNCGRYDNSLGWICCSDSCCSGNPAPNPTPAPSSSSSCPSNWVGDGYCDSGCNNKDNGYDDGDCCPSECSDGQYTCGSNGYDCYDCSQDGYYCGRSFYIMYLSIYIYVCMYRCIYIYIYIYILCHIYHSYYIASHVFFSSSLTSLQLLHWLLYECNLYNMLSMQSWNLHNSE